MATINVNPGGFASAYSAAAVGDTLLLQPGEHVIAGSGSRFTLSKRLNILGAGRTNGMFVTGSNGHNFDAIPVRVTGEMTVATGGTGSLLAGFGWQDNWASGPGTCLVSGQATFEDLVISNRRNGQPGTIFFTFGGSTRPDGVTVRRVRSRLIGDPTEGNHDHTYYIKNCTNLLIEDCIDYEGNDGWCFHFYPNGDNTLIRRCVVYQHTGGLTFSGANDSSTGLSGCLASDNNIIEDSILMNATRSGRYLVESFWGCSPQGTGNIVRDSDVFQGSGSGGRISTSNGGFSTSGLLNANPLFTNPAAGDFTLQAGSPALGMGPTYIQPGGSPPPTGPVATQGAVTSVAVHDFASTRTSVLFRNDPDRITPGG